MFQFYADTLSPLSAFVFTPYSLGYSVSFAICFFVVAIAWTRHSTRSNLLLLLMMTFAAAWSLFGIFEVSATAQEAKILFSKLEYFAGVPVPALLLLFSMHHVGMEKHITPGKIGILFIIPVITLILAFTNEYHGLVWSSFSPGPPESNLLIYGHGPWYWIGAIGYPSLCVIISSTLLTGFAITTHRKFRRRSILIMAGALIPWVAVLLYSSSFNPLPGYDMGRLAFSVSGLFFLLAITRGKLLELVPIERSIIFESIHEGVMVIDSRGVITDINPAAASLLGGESINFVGRAVGEIARLNPWIAAINDASSDATQLCLVANRSRSIEAGINMVKTRRGHQNKIVTLLDITEKVLLEEKKQELRDHIEVSGRLVTLSEMAAGITHEVNNPLTSVIGFSQLLLKSDLSDEARVYANYIAEESNRIKEIIKRMLTFARQDKPCKNRLDIRTTLEATLKIREYMLKHLGIDVIRNFNSDVPWVYVDPAQMQQVFLNLIINAEQAMQNTTKQKKLVVSTSFKEGRVSISFQNNGDVIPPDVMEKIFSPFFTTKEPGEGTGLGLSLSHSIVAIHNGEITAESKAGSGTCFTVSLPAGEPA